jgi:hypothetical protein
MSDKRRYSKASSRIAKRRKTKKLIKTSLGFLILIGFFVGSFYLLKADFLQVKSFEISGAETISTESIKSFASNFISGTKIFFVPKSNIVFLNKNNLSSALLSQFKKIESIKASRNFFNGSVNLFVIERKGEFLWCAEDGVCYSMTRSGLVFESSVASDGKIIFRGILGGDPIMKNYTSPEKMRHYINFIDILGSSGFSVSSINIKYSDKAIAETNIGDIYFSPNETDLNTVAENVILLVKEIKSKNPSSTFQYIDARFGNKIFYK